MCDGKISSLIAMTKMVEQFQSNFDLRDASRPSRGFTNFTVQEILKPSFGYLSKYEYDSDGTCISDSYDNYSSCDDAVDSDSVRSATPDTIDTYPSSNTRRCLCGIGSCADKLASLSSTERVATWSERVRRQLEDDGYSSSDSESALDLRIQRKKTLPQIKPAEIPAWVFCTRYSDRPSAGPRARRRRTSVQRQPRRARTAFTDRQIQALNIEFERDQYLSESKRQTLADDLGLHEMSVKIWFQNKRAKLKKEVLPNPLALELHAQGLYNHKVSADT